MATSRLDELRMVDPVLSTIAQGYENASMVAGSLFPAVSVSKIKGKIPVFGREAFVLKETARAIRAQSNRMPPSDVDFVEFETLEQDVEIALDYLEEEETPDFYRIEQRITKELMDILMLGKEKEAADYVQNASNFITALKTVIGAGEAFDDYTNTTDPIEVIRDGASAVRQRIGVYPNTMIIGESTYQTLMQHPKITDRIKYAGISAVNSKVFTELTDIANVLVGRAVYSEDGSSFSDVWNDNIIIAYVDRNERANRSEFNPSYGYTFQREGMPEVDSYFENGGKIKVIRATDNYVIKVTASDAAFLISNTNHS